MGGQQGAWRGLKRLEGIGEDVQGSLWGLGGLLRILRGAQEYGSLGLSGSEAQTSSVGGGMSRVIGGCRDFEEVLRGTCTATHRRPGSVWRGSEEPKR